MKRERWQQIEQIYNKALELDPLQRAAFLDKTCAGSESLRKKIEALLKGREEAGDFIKSPAIELLAHKIADELAPLEESRDLIGRQMSHYKIIEKIGEGGMGIVYRAEDTKLRRSVALKFLPKEISKNRQALIRFEREAQAASALNHPNICTIYDIDESEGQTFIAMELLEGQTLKQRIHSGFLKTKELLDTAIQITQAMGAAHAKNILHRDIKPANIFITHSGYAKILDFGLAKIPAMKAESTATTLTADPSITNAGSVVGTIAYMSPEQVRGENLDSRSDLFSFGIVLYEMATGRQAFTGNTSAMIFDAILHKMPIPPMSLNPALPNHIEQIINKSIEKDRNLRYQNTLDLVADLQRLKRDQDSGIKTETAVQKTGGIQSLAVLPFVNMGGDRDQEYFSDGLTEEIINALAKLSGLKVAARTSSFFFRGKEGDIRGIGAKLNVENVLEGSIRKSGNRIRVTAQLISIADGYHLWSERYDREMADVFAIQDDICRAIVDNLRIQFTAGRPLVKRSTGNVEAYNLCLKAAYHQYKGLPESIAKSKEYYEQAIALDPDYAAAWYGLASLYHLLGYLGYMPTKTAFVESSHAASKALALDETLPEAHALNGALRANNYDWKGAEREFQRALELDPESEDAWMLYDYYYLVPMRHLDEAVAASQKAVEGNPLSAFLQWRLGYRYYLTGQWDRAIEQCRNALELDPNYIFAHCYIGLSYAQKGNFDEALRAIEAAVQVAGRIPLLLGGLGQITAGAGRSGEARKILMELEALAQETYVQACCFCMIYIGLGEIDQALDWLEKAIDEHEGIILHFHVGPSAAWARSDPRYHVLLRKMNLEP